MKNFEIRVRNVGSKMNKILFSNIKAQFRLDLYGIHGIPHWARVQYFGLKIAKRENARTDVIKLFAFLHDSQRFSNSVDFEHGLRAVDYAKSRRDEDFEIDDQGFTLLCEALAGHSDGLIVASDITVETCWDADRLDLGRIGIYPNEKYLCTDTAKDPVFIHRAWSMTNE
jgi:uncharacterized protein